MPNSTDDKDKGYSIEVTGSKAVAVALFMSALMTIGTVTVCKWMLWAAWRL